MQTQLSQSDFDDLSAYLDGELPPDEASRVQQCIQTQAPWRQAYEELQSLAKAMDAYAVPAPAADLAQRIIAAARSQRSMPWFARAAWLAPAAAAAAIVIAAIVLRPTTQPVLPQTAQATPVTHVDDAFIVQTMDFFKDYDVVVNLDTLEAIDAAQAPNQQGS